MPTRSTSWCCGTRVRSTGQPWRRFGYTQDAEDVTQESFVRAWQSLPRFRGDAAFRTWVLTIAWRRALSRRQSVTQWFNRRVNLDEDVALPPSADRTDGPAVSLELRRHIVLAVQVLSPKLRDALLLAQSGEYEYDEIAAMLKIPLGTLKWRVSEARRKVRAHLSQLGYTDV